MEALCWLCMGMSSRTHPPTHTHTPHTQDRWLESLQIVKGRMSKLTSLRLEVDARRRK